MEEPNYEKATNLANSVLLDYADNILPIDLLHIVNQLPDVKLLTYSELLGDFNIDGTEISDEGFSITLDGNTVIAINDKKHDDSQRWTLAHELGHYFLAHENNSRFEYEQIEEREANNFARMLLQPFPVISNYLGLCESGHISSFNIAELFDVSICAAELTIKHLRKLYYLPNNKLLEMKFQHSLLHYLAISNNLRREIV